MGWGTGKGSNFHALSRHITLPAPPHVQQPGSSPNAVPWDFCGGFIIWAWFIINSTSTPSSLPVGWRVGPKVPSKSHLIRPKDTPIT